MSHIFLSYASKDRKRAKVLSDSFNAHGLSTWWDRTILPGQNYEKVIEQALDSAHCVVVLWSNASTNSDWVKDEAAIGSKRGILVPALIDPVDPPLGFRRLQTADLTGWDGSAQHSVFQQLIQSIEALGSTLNETPPALDAGTVRNSPRNVQTLAWTVEVIKKKNFYAAFRLMRDGAIYFVEFRGGLFLKLGITKIFVNGEKRTEGKGRLPLFLKFLLSEEESNKDHCILEVRLSFWGKPKYTIYVNGTKVYQE
jgi:hypothetical protein